MFVLLSKFWRERERESEKEREREREKTSKEREREGGKQAIVLVVAAVQFVSLVFGCLSGCFLNRVSVSKECVCKSRKQSETARGKLEKGEGERREEKRSRLV